MYSKISILEKSISSFLNKLNEDIKEKSKNSVLILGGHFLLLYDSIEDELKPCIWQSFEEEKFSNFAKLMAGNFPVDTLKIAINIKESCDKKNINSNLLMVVNDHKFQSKGFQNGIEEKINGKTGELRKKFYLKNSNLPSVFLSFFSAANINIEKWIFRNDDNKRSKTNILPKETIYFSEQHLRNKYENNRLPKLLKNNFASKKNKSNPNEYYLTLEDIQQDICLTENGSCGCIGLTIELLAELFLKKQYYIIFMIPNECADAVNMGIESGIKLFKTNCRIICISNLGGLGKCVENFEYSNIKMDIHAYE
jgi:hypothetical protein